MQTITEKMGIHKQWYEQAKLLKTPKELKEFMERLINDYSHDYGTIVHAICASMLGAYYVIENSPQGGITGFQAGCIGWKMVEKFMGINFPARIISFENMLYPQYEDKFTTISLEIWKILQEKAKEKLEKEKLSEKMKAHLESIVKGEVPFGWKVKKVGK